MKKTLHFYTCGILLLTAQGTLAQQLFNTSRSNYSGLGGATWNPATIADNRYGFQLHLLSVDGHATNSAYKYTGPWSLQTPGEELDLSSRYLTLRNQDKPSLVSVGLNARGPGLLVSLGNKHSIALGTRVRTALQGNDVSPDLIRNAVDEFDDGGRFSGNTLNLNMNAFAEWNLTYGRVVLNNGGHFLKAGLTVKRLMGAGSAYLQAESLDFEVAPPGAATDTTVRIRSLDGAFGYSNSQAFDDLDLERASQWLRGKNAPGSGWGADIGFVYEYRPNEAQYHYRDAKGVDRVDNGRNKYLYRLSVAVTDIGGIGYRDQAVAYNNLKANNLAISDEDVSDIELDNFDTQISRILRTQDLGKEDKFVAGLPTALNVDFDYHVWGKLYANASVSQGLRGRYAVGMRHFSYAALTPRLETRWLEIATPLSLANNYQQFAYGLMVRVGPLTVGSHNLSALVKGSEFYGTNAYAELALISWANKRYKGPKKVKTLKAPKAAKTVKAS